VRQKKALAAKELEDQAAAAAPGGEAASSSLSTPLERRGKAQDHFLSGFEPQRHTVYVLGRPVQASCAHPWS
jgi:hypothetical protein